VIVEDVVGLVSRDAGLEKPEAVGVDGADEQSAELVDCHSAQPLFGPLRDPLSKFARRSFCEREGDNGASGDTIGEKISDALRHNLGLARPSRRNDLQGTAAVPNRGQCGTFKLRSTRH
jgi:hypothetical protein